MTYAAPQDPAVFSNPARTRVCCAQLDVAFNQPAANVDASVRALRTARSLGADLVVFPECFLTGYCVSNAAEALAISLPIEVDSEGRVTRSPEPLTRVREEAESLGLHVIVGFAAHSGDDLFNAAALIEPGRPTRAYFKTHLPCLGYDRFATPGQSLPVFETELGHIGVLICFDIRPPEPARVMVLKGADIVCLPTNWPVGAFAGPQWIAPARAAENRVFVATSNRIGSENGFEFIGQSGIYDVSGRAVVLNEGTDLILASLDLSEARNKRTVIRPGKYETAIIGCRNPALYGELVKPNPSADAAAS